ncbi:cbb3-type cytochrome c oxidase subunit I [Flaviaesturariibacter aridisoli]|uniref:Cbb3-type cytochrome c oxidase subunit I n=2 Tax=Flaviaesturariibacter aridisoli TaxID=2545761 RepID=A0A4R4E776_9BACT|nr:cbb3-type cytochrome c oxidase subunit I [Flaviaesturariibacter aridisoli]
MLSHMSNPDALYRRSDRIALAFVALALCYLLLGLSFGLLGGLQYVLPAFLRTQLAFQKTRPLHVYLATSWIFTAAQAGLYFYVPRVAGRPLRWPKGGWLHFALQVVSSLLIIGCFFAGRFGGREYLEFPPALGMLIALSWLPLAVNFFATLRPRFRRAPVYYFSWTAGLLFFFITLSESYLWVSDYFFGNPVRDVTVQWKALGSMVGSWNMLIYGCSLYVMQQLNGDKKLAQGRTAFFFFFLGFTNLLFNWGHHTYVVPAAPWVRSVSYAISMTELLLLAQLLFKFRRTMSEARRRFHSLTFRLLSLADGWILLNLVLAIALSVPAINRYTHGTHITVAHAMGATIGINSMLLLASISYMLTRARPQGFAREETRIKLGVWISNGSLLLFWISLLGSGLVKIAGTSSGQSFATIMQRAAPLFRLFAGSGAFLFAGLALIVVSLLRVLWCREPKTVQDPVVRSVVVAEPAAGILR